jgi:putative hydrolase of the HAD superfamily
VSPVVKPVDLVLFDAVGTLIEPFPAVADVYHSIGSQFGYRESQARLSADFALAFHRSYALQTHERQGRTSESLEVARWRTIVRETFDGLESPEVDLLFAQLWNHFADAAHWRVFSDVAATLTTLRERGYRLGIASNFDERLCGICQTLPPLGCFESIFISSRIGWSKPAPQFYREVEKLTGLAPQRIMLIGDDSENDAVVPRNLGWHARWLVRQAAKSSAGQLRSLDELLAELP